MIRKSKSGKYHKPSLVSMRSSLKNILIIGHQQEGCQRCEESCNACEDETKWRSIFLDPIYMKKVFIEMNLIENSHKR